MVLGFRDVFISFFKGLCLHNITNVREFRGLDLSDLSGSDQQRNACFLRTLLRLVQYTMYKFPAGTQKLPCQSLNSALSHIHIFGSPPRTQHDIVASIPRNRWLGLLLRNPQRDPKLLHKPQYPKLETLPSALSIVSIAVPFWSWESKNGNTSMNL